MVHGCFGIALCILRAIHTRRPGQGAGGGGGGGGAFDRLSQQQQLTQHQQSFPGPLQLPTNSQGAVALTQDFMRGIMMAGA